MNQLQRKYLLGRLEEETKLKLNKIPSYNTKGPYWRDFDLEKWNKFVVDATALMQSHFPEMNPRLSQNSPNENSHHASALIAFGVGPTSEDKHKVYIPEDTNSRREKVRLASRKVSDQIMLGDHEEVMAKLEEFSKMEF